MQHEAYQYAKEGQGMRSTSHSTRQSFRGSAGSACPGSVKCTACHWDVEPCWLPFSTALACTCPSSVSSADDPQASWGVLIATQLETDSAAHDAWGIKQNVWTQVFSRMQMQGAVTSSCRFIGQGQVTASWQLTLGVPGFLHLLSSVAAHTVPGLLHAAVSDWLQLAVLTASHAVFKNLAEPCRLKTTRACTYCSDLKTKPASKPKSCLGQDA